MARNIFPERSQAGAEVLGDMVPQDVLVVPIDFAKRVHVAQFVDKSGDLLRKKPLTIRNDLDGVDYLAGKIDAHCRKHGIGRDRVLVGGEDPAEYALNFAVALEARGYRFVRVNAGEAKKQRSNTRATSDELALCGIARTMMGRFAYDLRPLDEAYGALRMASRAYRSLGVQITATRNRIHKDVELLFPGLLDKKSGLPPFGPGSLAFMEEGFTMERVRRMRTDTLARFLGKAGTQEPDVVAARVKALAELALPPAPGIVEYRRGTLARKVALLRRQVEAQDDEENEMARCLVRTPGFLLTSIPGLGVVLAGGLVGECGDPRKWRGPDRTMSYAGLAVRQHQTGGPDKEPVVLGLPRDANHHLKDILLQAAFHVGTAGHPVWRDMGLPGTHPLRETYLRVGEAEGHERMATAKKLLRVAHAMLRDNRVYLPAEALAPGTPGAMPVECVAEFEFRVGGMLKDKWRPYNLAGIPDEENHLERFLEDTKTLSAFLARQRQNK